MTVSIMDIIDSTTVDGPGLRTSVYAAGCRHRCDGCHNPQSWPFSAGHEMDTDDVVERILSNRMENVTFSGGDPMFQAEAFTLIAQEVKRRSDKNIWCYTGFTFGQLLSMPDKMKLVSLVDVLVDGRYDKRLRDTGLLFCGSSNQRLIDVRKSIDAGEVVIYEPHITASYLQDSI